MTRPPSFHLARPSRALTHRIPLAAMAAGLLMLSACGNSSTPSSSPSQVAARVNKEEISVHQINFVLQRQQGLKPEQTEAASRQVLERLIDQQVAVQKAEELKLDREPRVVQALAAARDEIVARAYLERIAEHAAKPTPEEVLAYYDGKPGLFKARRVYSLQELQVQASGDTLAQLREKVQGAKSIQEVTDFIRDNKLPARASQNTAPAESLPLALVEQFSKMKPGNAIFLPAPGGARIVVVAAAQDAPKSLDVAKPLIETALLSERRREAVANDLKSLRQSGKVEYVGRFAEAAASGVPAAEPSQAAASAAPVDAAPPLAAASSADVDTAMVNRGLAGLK